MPTSAQAALLREGVLLQLAAVSHTPRSEDAALAAACDAAHAVLVEAVSTPAHGLWLMEAQAGCMLSHGGAPSAAARERDVVVVAEVGWSAQMRVVVDSAAAHVWQPSKALQGAVQREVGMMPAQQPRANAPVMRLDFFCQRRAPGAVSQIVSVSACLRPGVCRPGAEAALHKQCAPR